MICVNSFTHGNKILHLYVSVPDFLYYKVDHLASAGKDDSLSSETEIGTGNHTSKLIPIQNEGMVGKGKKGSKPTSLGLIYHILK